MACYTWGVLGVRTHMPVMSTAAGEAVFETVVGFKPVPLGYGAFYISKFM